MKKLAVLILFLSVVIFTKKSTAQKVTTSVFYEPYVEVPHYFPQFPIMFYNEEFRAYKDLPFMFLFNDIVSNMIAVYGPAYVNASDTTNYPIMETATFYPFFTQQLIDKSYLTGSTQHQSKLYFWMDTVNGEQIFKIEWKNMGFKNCTANDSLNMQVWMFERSNKVQYRYGKSNLTYPNLFNSSDTTFIGFEIETENNFYYGTFEGKKDSIFYKDMYAWGNVIGIPKEGTVIEIKANETTVNTSAKKLEKGLVLMQNELVLKLKFLQEGIELKQMELYNLNGECILRSSEMELEVSLLPKGMYVLKIETNKGVYTEKYIK